MFWLIRLTPEMVFLENFPSIKQRIHGLTLGEAALAGQQAQSLVERASAEDVLYS